MPSSVDALCGLINHVKLKRSRFAILSKLMTSDTFLVVPRALFKTNLASLSQRFFSLDCHQQMTIDYRQSGLFVRPMASSNPAEGRRKCLHAKRERHSKNPLDLFLSVFLFITRKYPSANQPTGMSSSFGGLNVLICDWERDATTTDVYE